jgi:hypothetical protein
LLVDVLLKQALGAWIDQHDIRGRAGRQLADGQDNDALIGLKERGQAGGQRGGAGDNGDADTTVR